MNKKSFYLLLFSCLAVFCLFLYLVFKGLFVAPPIAPSNTPFITPFIAPSTTTPSASVEMEEEPERGLEISMLIDKIPYYGTFFSLTYDFNTALFTVNIDPANKNEGEKEFNDFLKQNGVPDESYITGLKTTYFPRSTNTTPAP